MKNAYFEIEIINYFGSIRRRLLLIPHFLSVLETTENNRLSPVIKSTTFVCDSVFHLIPLARVFLRSIHFGAPALNYDGGNKSIFQ